YTTLFRSIAVTVAEVNQAPVLAAIGDRSVDELAVLGFTATTTDGDIPANTLTFSLVGAPAGAVITTGGQFAWTPTEAQGPGTHTFTVEVCDNGTPGLCDTEEISVTVGEVNQAPILDPIGEQTADELVELSFIATATDGDAPANTLTFSLVGEPAGAGITAGGAFSWTPDATQGPGAYAFDICVSDGLDQDCETISVSVSSPSVALSADLGLSLSASPDPVSPGGPLTYTVRVANAGPDDAQSVVVTLSLPAGSDLDSTEGSGWTCSLAGDTLTCSLAQVAASTSAPDLIVLVSAPSTPGMADAEASVSSTTDDPDAANNTADAAVAVVRIAPAAEHRFFLPGIW
ncbi:MAG: DUF11 domain-containing protein, partial [Anaerolineae bacterium]